MHPRKRLMLKKRARLRREQEQEVATVPAVESTPEPVEVSATLTQKTTVEATKATTKPSLKKTRSKKPTRTKKASS